MSTTVFDNLSGLPCALTAGEAVTWTETPTDYPPADYKLTYEFAGQTPQDGYQQFSIDGSESGPTYTFVVPITIKPGIYNWQKKVQRTSDNRKSYIGRGQLTVRANLAIAATVTAAAAQLAALNAALATLAIDRSVSFNGQSFSREDIKQLQDQRTRLQAEVDRENQQILALSGESRNGRVAIRFVPSQGWDYRGGYPCRNDGRY